MRSNLIAGLVIVLIPLFAADASAQSAEPPARAVGPSAADAASEAADPPSIQTIQNVRARQTRSLNGHWRTIVDPFETGYYDYRYQPMESGGFSQNRRPQHRSDLIEYDFDTSDQLLVPGDWNSQRDDLFFYEGTIWYKRDFDYDLADDRRLFAYFGAANYEARAWLNGTSLGMHEGGFTPFNFEVTDLVQEEDNFLIVKVDNQRRREAVPTVNFDWWNYGGLTRDVMLVDVPETFIRDYFIQLDPRSSGEVAGWIRLDGPRAQQRVTIHIPEAGVETAVTTDESGYAEVRFPADLERWSPENPRQYRVVVESETDRVEDVIGFRTIETRGTEILLNGESVFLRGVCIHEQAPMRDGRAFSEEDARTLLGWAREMGANFVRLAHYPHNEHMTRVASEMGLMVWSEVPVYWTILWDNPETLESARRQLTEMIARDKNRASVVLWAVANETPLSDERLAFLTNLVSLTRDLDPSRLVTAALERHYANDTTQAIDDPLGAHLDVVGVNEYIGWYEGTPARADSMTWTMAYDKPLIISEFGGSALHGLHGDELTRWTEEYQRSIYEHQIGMLERIPFLRGTTPWILTDFRSPRRPLPDIQDYWNRKGLISDRGQRKQAFYVMQEWYRGMMEGRSGE